MGHETGDVALAVADSSDIVHCSVGIAGVIVGTVGSGVAENHLAVLLELSERSLVAEVIAVGKSARQDDGVAIREIFRLVPDEFDGFPENVADGVKRVVVAIGPGKNDDSKFHAVAAPCNLAGTASLAHTREFRRGG